MFLQRNTASQVFVIPGSLRAVADGSAVTSTATITVVKDGTSAAGAGTLTHISGGAYKYAPTQGETDCKILGYVVEATGAITLAGSVRTTAADPNDATALGLTNIDATVTSRMATYTQPTGFLAATFPTTVASTTNITAGTITTVTTTTNLTNLPAITSNWLTAAGLAADAVAEIQSGLSTLDASGVRTAVGLASANLDTQLAALPTAAENADAVWDEILSGHAGVGSAGAALAAAGGSGDPWSTALPGAYGAGTAGYIVGTNIDALITSRMASYTQPTGFLAATFPTTVASTTNITAASGVSLASAGLDSVVVESGINVRQAMSAIMASAAGVLSGADTGTVVIKGGGVATTRITATTDADGNRSAITLNLPT